jgi:MFS family permease
MEWIEPPTQRFNPLRPDKEPDMHTYWKAIRSFSPDVLRYLAFQSALTFAFIGTINVLLNLYLLRLGYGTGFIGSLSAAGMLVWGFLALPAGAVGARLGLKRTMMLAFVGMALMSLLLVLAGWLPPAVRGAGLVTAWMALWGSAALATVNSLPYVMAITSDENRAYVFSLQQVLAAVVTLTGALVSGNLPGVLARWLGQTLDQPLPYQLTLFLSPVFYLVAAWILHKSSQVTAVSQHDEQGRGQAVPYLAFVMLLLIVVLQSASDGFTRVFFNVYLDQQLQVPVAQIGAILGLAQLFPAVVSLGIPLIIARLGTRVTMLTGTGLSVGFILLLAWVPTSTAASISLMGLAGLMAITMTARSIFSQEIVSPRWRTTMSAMATIGISVGWALAAWQGGVLVKTLGYRGLFLIGAALALLAVGLIVADGWRARVQKAVDEEMNPLERSESGDG